MRPDSRVHHAQHCSELVPAQRPRMNSGSGVLAMQLVELSTSVLVAQRHVRVLGLDPRSEPVLRRLGVVPARVAVAHPRLPRCAPLGLTWGGTGAPELGLLGLVGVGAIVGLVGAEGRAERGGDGRCTPFIVGELRYGAYSCKECASLGVRDPEELSPRLESAMSEQRVQRLLRCKGVFNGSMRDYPIARRRPGCSTRVVQPLLRAALARATSRRSSRCAASRRSPYSKRYHALPFLEALELQQIEEVPFPLFTWTFLSRGFPNLRISPAKRILKTLLHPRAKTLKTTKTTILFRLASLETPPVSARRLRRLFLRGSLRRHKTGGLFTGFVCEGPHGDFGDLGAFFQGEPPGPPGPGGRGKRSLGFFLSDLSVLPRVAVRTRPLRKTA